MLRAGFRQMRFNKLSDSTEQGFNYSLTKAQRRWYDCRPIITVITDISLTYLLTYIYANVWLKAQTSNIPIKTPVKLSAKMWRLMKLWT